MVIFHKANSRLINKTTINKLVKDKKVKLLWIFSHSGVKDNVIADKLAKLEVKKQYTGS